MEGIISYLFMSHCDSSFRAAKNSLSTDCTQDTFLLSFILLNSNSERQSTGSVTAGTRRWEKFWVLKVHREIIVNVIIIIKTFRWRHFQQDSLESLLRFQRHTALSWTIETPSDTLSWLNNDHVQSQNVSVFRWFKLLLDKTETETEDFLTYLN